jgi:hypothetical protein
MIPAAYIALARDLIILVALGLLIWLLVSYGKDVVKVADMKAVQKQLAENTQIETAWRQEQTDANTKRDADLAKVSAGIAGQHAPVYVVRNTARACPVPEHSPQAGGAPTSAGGIDAGSGGSSETEDVRPKINQFELKFETAMADCRAILDQWPRNENP